MKTLTKILLVAAMVFGSAVAGYMAGSAAPNCQTNPEICDNGRDDDGDGLIDCEDPGCRFAPNCQIHPEICDNGWDDDGDGLRDCYDPDCRFVVGVCAAPAGADCHPDVIGWRLAPRGRRVWLLGWACKVGPTEVAYYKWGPPK